jgi:hypothetical protein
VVVVVVDESVDALVAVVVTAVPVVDRIVVVLDRPV